MEGGTGLAMEIGTVCAVLSLGTNRCVSKKVSVERVERMAGEWREKYGWGSNVLYNGPLY